MGVSLSQPVPKFLRQFLGQGAISFLYIFNTHPRAIFTHPYPEKFRASSTEFLTHQIPPITLATPGAASGSWKFCSPRIKHHGKKFKICFSLPFLTSHLTILHQEETQSAQQRPQIHGQLYPKKYPDTALHILCHIFTDQVLPHTISLWHFLKAHGRDW